LMMFAVAAPAGATVYLRNWQVSSETTPSSASLLKAATTACPTGYIALGAGAAGPGDSMLNRLGIEERTAHQGAVRPVVQSPWVLSTQIFCAKPTSTPPTSTTGRDYVKDVVLVNSSSVAGGANQKGTTAICPRGHTVIGAGAVASPWLTAPYEVMRTGNRVRVFAREAQPTEQSWGAFATAICANIDTAGSRYVTALRSVTVQSASTSEDKRVVASCPSPLSLFRRQYAIGGGAEVLGAGSGAPSPPPAVILSSSAPFFPTASTRSRAWAAVAQESSPTDIPWRLRVRVVCAHF
jgi:hypothetical protein